MLSVGTPRSASFCPTAINSVPRLFHGRRTDVFGLFSGQKKRPPESGQIHEGVGRLSDGWTSGGHGLKAKDRGADFCYSARTSGEGDWLNGYRNYESSVFTATMPKIKKPDIVHPARTPQSETRRSVQRGSISCGSLYEPFFIAAPYALLNSHFPDDLVI